MKPGNKHAMKGNAPASAKVIMRVTDEKKEVYKRMAALNNLTLTEWIQSVLDTAVKDHDQN